MELPQLFSKENRSRIVSYALSIVCIITLWYSCNNSDEGKKFKNLYEAANDTITRTRNELGQERSSTSLMVATHASDILELKTKDSTIMKLQESIKDYKGKLLSATVISITSTDKGSSATNIVGSDTVRVHDSVKVYPRYYSEWSERWSKGHITATKDSISRYIQMMDDLTITQGLIRDKRWKIWKEPKPTIDVLNSNPNVSVTALKGFIVQLPPKRFSLGVGLSYGYNVQDVISLNFTNPSLNIGLTGSFVLLRF